MKKKTKKMIGKEFQAAKKVLLEWGAKKIYAFDITLDCQGYKQLSIKYIDREGQEKEYNVSL